jgi:hypothetical protein
MAAAPDSSRPSISAFQVERFRAFDKPQTVELGRITLLLGRNNSGKTALCLAPFYFVQAFLPDTPAPLPNKLEGIDFGNLQSVVYQRQATGTVVRFKLESTPGLSKVELGITFVPEKHNAQQITFLRLVPDVDSTNDLNIKLPSWDETKAKLKEYPSLHLLPKEVSCLRGVRPLPGRRHEYLGHTPRQVDPLGENAPMMLLSSGEEGLQRINRWYSQLNLSLEISKQSDVFEVLATGTSREPANVLDSGSGVVQLLPLLAQLELASQLPRLWCIEQPELHLHPRAHVLVAEILIDFLRRHTSTRILVETHSDILVLRLRREVAAGRLTPDDLRIYFVDEEKGQGSIVEEVGINDEGTPLWWPKGVFAEPQKEYFAIRRELAHRKVGSE